MAQTLTSSTVRTGHSAIVEMILHVGTKSFRVGQAGLDFLILDEPKEIPPGPAEFVIEIDGEESRRRVFLPEGIRADNVEVRVTPIT